MPSAKKFFSPKPSKTSFSNPRPISIVGIQDLIAISVTFLPNYRLYYFVYCLFTILDFLFLFVRAVYVKLIREKREHG